MVIAKSESDKFHSSSSSTIRVNSTHDVTCALERRSEKCVFFEVRFVVKYHDVFALYVNPVYST